MKLRSRSLILALCLSAASVWAQSAAQMEVFKSATCGCCEQWIEHLRQHGFRVSAHNVDDVSAARKQLGMPERLGACHTAKIGKYIIEGHVPAADIQRLLKEKPKALGLAVPSMPPGSPGMESATPIPYDTLLVQTDGRTSVYAHH